MASAGFVYVITNKAMPGLVKVGRTSRTPEHRARELGGAGAPYPYEVRYALKTTAHHAIEAAAHRVLRSFRLKHAGGGIEWFACTVKEATEAIRKAAQTVEGWLSAGSLMRSMASIFRRRLRTLDTFLLVVALAIVCGPALLPLLVDQAQPHLALVSRNPASAQVTLLNAQSALVPAMREAQASAAAWAGFRLALMLVLACHRRQRGNEPMVTDKPATRKRGPKPLAKTIDA